MATTAVAAHADELSSPSVRRPITVDQSVLRVRQRSYYSLGQRFTVKWQDYGQPLPGWFDAVMQGSADVLTLPANWDSYGAGPINRPIVDLDFVKRNLAASHPAPRVVPLSSGGRQLEWHRKGIDLEIVFEPGDPPFFYSVNHTTRVEKEQALPEGVQELVSIIGSLE